MPIFQDPALEKMFVYDGVTAFNRVNSFGRASGIEPDALAGAINMDLNFSAARTRRGIEALGSGLPTSRVQGLCFLDVGSPAILQLLLAIVNAVPYSWDGTTWTALTGYTPPTTTQQVTMAALVDLLYIGTAGMDLRSWDGTTFVNLGPRPTQTSTAIVGDGTNATVTMPAHGYLTGSRVTVTGAIDVGFNGTYELTVLDVDHFTYPNTTAPTTATTQGTFVQLDKPKQYSIVCTHTYRIFGAGLPDLPDTLECSDILDGSTWEDLTNSSRVGGGESDPITGLCSWSNFNLVVGKRNSIWMVTADPSLSPADWQMQRVTGHAGCVAHATMAQVGEDVLWLSKDGVRSLDYTLQGLTQGVSEPISRPIQDVIDQINWAAAYKASAIYWNNRYILSVPLGTSPECDTVLVYNTITESWSGTWNGWNATCFMATFFGDNARLVMGRIDGTMAQWMEYVPEASESPANFQDMGQDFASSMQSRGMNCTESISPKQGFSGEIEFWKSLTEADVSVSLDGGGWNLFWSGPSTPPSGSNVGDPLDWTLGIKSYWRIARDLIRFGSWRELQFQVAAERGKLQVRSIYLAAHLEKFQGEEN